MAAKAPYTENAQIEHPKFGAGTILTCDEQYVVISFDDHGEKKFVSSIAVPHLKKLDREPPEKKPRARKSTRTRKTTSKSTKTSKATGKAPAVAKAAS